MKKTKLIHNKEVQEKIGLATPLGIYIALFIVALFVAQHDYIVGDLTRIDIALVMIALTVYLCFIVWCIKAVKKNWNYV